jgi:3',5'-cyclic AMP phosphodiesterase CpdA
VISRRRFVSSLLTAASGAVALAAAKSTTSLFAQAPTDGTSEAWALLSDTHIAADAGLEARGINMAAHLRQTVQEVLQAHARRSFSGLMINGDCAYLDGQADDYKTLGMLVKPVLDKGIPMHFTLGNHDERAQIQAGFASVFDTPKTETSDSVVKERAVLQGKLASKVRGRFCDWYLLDSLDVTNKTPGRIGDEQLGWLDAALKASADRPALVMVHHNPQPEGSAKVSGLLDTAALLSLLKARRQVKALFFGHTHVAKIVETDGLHLVNLPACAYRFSPEQPTGWTSALVRADGCSLTLFDTNKAHSLHAQEVRLAWR